MASFLNTTKIDSDNVQAAGLTLSRLASGTSGQIIVVNGSGVPAYVTPSGPVAISNAGVTSIVAGSFVNADISASAAIAHSKLAATTAGYLLMGTTTTGVITGTALSGDATITGAGALTIANSAITTAKILDANVTLGKMAANSVDSDQYVDGSIDAEHLSTAAILLGSASRTTDTGSITAASDIADLPVTFTMPTTSRKVRVSFYCPSFTTSGGSTVASVQIKEGATLLQEWKSEVFSTAADAINGCYMQVLLTGVSAGSHTYKITAARTTGSGSFVMKGDATYPMQTVVELL